MGVGVVDGVVIVLLAWTWLVGLAQPSHCWQPRGHVQRGVVRGLQCEPEVLPRRPLGVTRLEYCAFAAGLEESIIVWAGAPRPSRDCSWSFRKDFDDDIRSSLSRVE